MLVAVAAVGLQLKGAVVYAYAVKQLFGTVRDLVKKTRIGNDYMAGQRRLGSGDGPDAKMVHPLHTLQGTQT